MGKGAGMDNFLPILAFTALAFILPIIGASMGKEESPYMILLTYLGGMFFGWATWLIVKYLGV